MQATSNQSVFNMSSGDRDWFTRNRLHAQENSQAYWGCASMSGFLAQGEDLLECCEKDKQTLNEKGITYTQIAQKIIFIVNTASKEGVDKLVDLKFKVTIGEKSLCNQYCPFSPKGADWDASPFQDVENACGLGNREITILNTKNNRSITFGSLIVHLIEQHHFFEGSVPHRLPPIDAIETLELASETLKG
jgi:hypothetical protein